MTDWNEEIAPKLLAGWSQLVTDRPDLFLDKANEDTVSDAFKSRLEGRFDGFEIDTDYDRMNADLRRAAKKAVLGTAVKEIFPDIVIHVPGEDDLRYNLLTIEMKKWNNYRLAKDLLKLAEMTRKPKLPRKFQYEYGLLIRFRPTGAIGMAKLFHDGQSLDLDPESLEKRT